MCIRQLSVFLENRAGQLSEIAELLSAAGIDLRAINIAETADYGLLRLIANAPHQAAALLEEHGFVLTISEVLAVAVPDVPGGMAALLRILSAAGIDIEYLYSIFGQNQGRAYMVFHVAERERALELLAENGLSAADEEELGIH